jgi:hypothetical protein
MISWATPIPWVRLQIRYRFDGMRKKFGVKRLEFGEKKK